jgi:hypothetical protein
MGGIRFEPDGTVTFITGTLDYGQGHATTFAQILSDRLGVPFERIRLLQGDSDELVTGGGTGGSRSAAASSMAMVAAIAKVIEQGKLVVSHVLEAAAADIEFASGRFTIAGTDRSIGIMDLAAQLRAGRLDLPDDAPKSLDVKLASEPVPAVFPNGCHVAEVEVDPETGAVEVVKYASICPYVLAKIDSQHQRYQLLSHHTRPAKGKHALVAAQQNIPIAQFSLADMLLNGDIGVPRDQDRGLEYLEAAARNGFVPARIRLGDAYDKANPSVAFKWFAAAANAGSTYAQYQLSRFFYYGIVGPKDRRSPLRRSP